MLDDIKTLKWIVKQICRLFKKKLKEKCKWLCMRYVD